MNGSVALPRVQGRVSYCKTGLVFSQVPSRFLFHMLTFPSSLALSCCGSLHQVPAPGSWTSHPLVLYIRNGRTFFFTNRPVCSILFQQEKWTKTSWEERGEEDLEAEGQTSCKVVSTILLRKEPACQDKDELWARWEGRQELGVDKGREQGQKPQVEGAREAW